MNAQDLKNSILQLAVQGKLVEQRPEEGTAKELIDQIKAEKEQLIKDKKIKKEKKEEELCENPFDIPDTWIWTRLGDIFYNKSGLSYKKGDLDIVTDDMVRVFRGGNILELEYKLKDDDVMISRPLVKDDLYLKKNMLITPAVTSLEHIGKMARIDQDMDDTVVGGFVLMLIPYVSNDILSEYLLYALSSHYHRSQCRKITNKSGQAFYNLSREKLMNFYVPIPPLAEQKRIVAKIEEILPYIEQYDKAYTKLEAFNKKFPEDMKKSILQMAMQGKLVEQRPEEGNAEELYEQIIAEKTRLIKEGKIKKEKPLAEITEDEIPFDIPESWKWVRLSDLATFYGGYAYKSNKYVACANNQVIRLGNVKNDKMILSTNPVYIDDEYALETEKYKILIGDILFTMTGTRGKRDYFYTVLVEEDDLDRFTLYLNQRVGCLRGLSVVDKSWLCMILKSEVVLKQVFENETGTANQGNIGSEGTMSVLIPLPPLAEQKRIVAKLEQMLPYCNQLIK